MSKYLRRLTLTAIIFFSLSPSSHAAHAYAQFGDMKYPAGFHHFDWVNPDAPKGGSIALISPTRETNFDKYNPFTLKGNAPPGLAGLLFETLLTGTMDEPTTAYGLLAEDITVAPDKLSATFRLNPAAHFQNGKPVLAADVKYSFDTIISKQAAPQFRVIFGDIKQAVVTGERTIRFDFVRESAELPLLVGSALPVFSREWGKGEGQKNGQNKPFDQIIMEEPISTGPYRIGQVNFGREITYDRDPNYWAHDLNVRRGRFNFDHITYKVYKDTTAQTEAFKAGEFDYIQVFSAKEWARLYTGPKFNSGELIKRNFESGNAGDFQGFFINTRREKFQDVRVREALDLALDYEWMNRQFFFNSYTRVRGFFNASDFEAKNLPSDDELSVLETFRNKLPAEVFTQPVPLPPTTTPPNSLRSNLLHARQLLADAGWTFRDGALRNAKNEAFTLEILDSQGSMQRLFAPYNQALAKLGIEATYKQADFALVQKRLETFDFDMTSIRSVGSEAPGSELLDRFGAESAKTEGSSNLAGVHDPVVDALVKQALASTTRPQLVARLRALDRVLRWGHYVVPHWYSGGFRVSYRSGKFEQPQIMPKYYQVEDWVISTWWASSPK